MALIAAQKGSSGGGESNGFYSDYTKTTSGMTVTTGRMTVDSGGYFIKNGVCYVDMSITCTLSTPSTKKSFATMPHTTSSSQINLINSKVGGNLSTYIQDYDGVTSFEMIRSVDGEKYNIIGSYPTDQADTV